MTWAEFQIRAYSYNRQQERLDFRAREIAYSALISTNVDPKKLPKSKDKFWKIGNKSVVNDGMQNAIKKAQEQYLKAKQSKNG